MATEVEISRDNAIKILKEGRGQVVEVDDHGNRRRVHSPDDMVDSFVAVRGSRRYHYVLVV